MTNFTFIDLFCGIGGFHQAMMSLGGKCVFASDIDEDCRKTYEANYGLKPVGDITKIDAKDIPAHDVLCAGFPCQAFSKAGKRLGFEDETKGTLFFDICRILDYHKPKYALLENVRNLASAGAQIVVFKATDHSKIIRGKIKDMGLPYNCTIGGLVRAGEGVLVNGDTEIVRDDEVVVFCKSEIIRQLEKFFQ